MQRVWIAQGEPRSPVFDTSTPTFPLQRSYSQNKAAMSTFMPHDSSKRPPIRSNSSVTSNSVPKLPPNNPRRSSSQSPNNFYPPNNLDHHRQNSLGKRPYYSAVPNNGGNVSPMYQYPNPNAPPPLLHNNQNNLTHPNDNMNGKSQFIIPFKTVLEWQSINCHNFNMQSTKSSFASCKCLLVTSKQYLLTLWYLCLSTM